MNSSMRSRARKPASAVERDALATWQQAKPSAAMTALADAGYDQAARAEFLRNVVRLSAEDVADFSADSYVMPADDEYGAGIRDGATAGATDHDNGADTVRTSNPNPTTYDDGYSDGYWTRAYLVSAMDIVGYTFNAENLCPECTVAAVASGPQFEGWALAPGIRMSAEENLDEIAAAFGVKREDESSFDSGDFPKVIFASMVEDAETCGHCGDELI